MSPPAHLPPRIAYVGLSNRYKRKKSTNDAPPRKTPRHPQLINNLAQVLKQQVVIPFTSCFSLVFVVELLLLEHADGKEVSESVMYAVDPRQVSLFELAQPHAVCGVWRACNRCGLMRFAGESKAPLSPGGTP